MAILVANLAPSRVSATLAAPTIRDVSSSFPAVPLFPELLLESLLCLLFSTGAVHKASTMLAVQYRSCSQSLYYVSCSVPDLLLEPLLCQLFITGSTPRVSTMLAVHYRIYSQSLLPQDYLVPQLLLQQVYEDSVPCLKVIQVASTTDMRRAVCIKIIVFFCNG